MGSREDLAKLVKGIKSNSELKEKVFRTKKEEKEFKLRELRWAIHEKVGEIKVDFNGHNNGCDIDFYSKRLKHSLWVSNALTSIRKMHRLLEAMEQGITVEFPVPLKPFSYETCYECGERLPITFDGKTFKAESKCQFPEGMPAYSIDLPVPSGKLVIANDLRRLFDDEFKVAALKKGMGGSFNFDLNTAMGCRQVFETYGSLGMAHGFVGNTCPGVYRVDENTLTLSMVKCEEDFGDVIKAEIPGEHVAGVCTDLWWYSIMDYDKYVEKAGKEPDRHCNIVDVKPGIYKVTHRTHLFDTYANATDHYAIIKWEKD
jgi:hypothetical protein